MLVPSSIKVQAETLIVKVSEHKAPEHGHKLSEPSFGAYFSEMKTPCLNQHAAAIGNKNAEKKQSAHFDLYKNESEQEIAHRGFQSTMLMVEQGLV